MIFGAPRMPPTPRRRFREVFAKFSRIFVENAGAIFFSKNRSRRRDQFGPKIVKIRAILAIFEPFEILLFGKISRKIREKSTCHFLANSADRPGIYIETLYKSNFPRDVCLNSSKSGRWIFKGTLVADVMV